MLFELATAVPELLTAAKRAAIEATTLSQSHAKAQLQKSAHITAHEKLFTQQAKQRQRHTQQHQVVDVARESAMLQVCKHQESHSQSASARCHPCLHLHCSIYTIMLPPGC